MKYLVLTVILLSGCSTSRLDKKREYADICKGTNVKSVAEENREVECYPDLNNVGLRLIQ